VLVNMASFWLLHLKWLGQRDHLKSTQSQWLQGCGQLGPSCLRKLERLREYGMQRGAPGVGLLQSWGFGKDEIEDMGEVLAKMVMQLDPYSQMSSESDWD